MARTSNDTADGAAATVRARSDRFWFERRGDDLPFYNGLPTRLSIGGWLLVLLGVALGFTALIVPVPALQAGLFGFAPSLLFVAIPLVALMIAAPRGWTRIFRAIRPGDVWLMLGFALLNIAVTVVIGFAVETFLGAEANPIFTRLPAMSAGELLLFFGRTIPQLFGEEVLTILPFLALMTLLYGQGASRRWAIIVAWIASAALFGALHLPTYGWNLAQCLLIIGGARLVLTLPYLLTSNIWASAGAHILNDWILFGLVMLLASRA